MNRFLESNAEFKFSEKVLVSKLVLGEDVQLSCSGCGYRGFE